jgi:hypothetical protein
MELVIIWLWVDVGIHACASASVSASGNTVSEYYHSGRGKKEHTVAADRSWLVGFPSQKTLSRWIDLMAQLELRTALVTRR